MFGSHFYHERIRKTVAVFGSLFNDINIIRKDAQGAVISQMKVPLSYAPKRDFLARIENMDAGDDFERQIAVKLPRMSFEIISMGYDNARQLPKMNQCIKGNIDARTGQRLYSPVPYNVQFQLNIYAKSQDDALQVVEQILPYFTPHYTVSIKPLTDIPKLIEDVPITLEGVSFSDDYEASLEARRTIIYTLDFSMSMNLFKDFGGSEPIITDYDVGLLDLEGNELFRVQDSAPSFSPTSFVLSEDASTYSTAFTVRNAPTSSYNFYISSPPANGTATVSYTETLTTVAGVVTAIGSYSYTPDSDWFGTDTFDITLLYGDSAQLSSTITATVGSVADIILNPVSLVGVSEALITFNLLTNDTFDSSTTYDIISQPTNGTASIDGNGLLSYTSDSLFGGTDQLTYRATPTTGIAETAVIDFSIELPPWSTTLETNPWKISSAVEEEEGFSIANDQYFTVSGVPKGWDSASRRQGLVRGYKNRDASFEGFYYDKYAQTLFAGGYGIGFATTMQDDFVFASSMEDSANGVNDGNSVYKWRLSQPDKTLSEIKLISEKPLSTSTAIYGKSISASGTRVAISEQKDIRTTNPDSEAPVYIHDIKTGALQRTIRNPDLTPENTGFYDDFGASIGLYGDYLAVGIPTDRVNNEGGSVMISDVTNGNQIVYLSAPSTGNKWFGDRVAMHKNYMVATHGRPAAGNDVDIRVYRTSSDWSDVTYASPLHTFTTPIGFGCTLGGLAINADANLIAIGWENYPNTNGTAGQGRVYLHALDSGGLVTNIANPDSDASYSQSFGQSVSLSRNVLSVGAHEWEPIPNATATDAGKTYIFPNPTPMDTGASASASLGDIQTFMGTPDLIKYEGLAFLKHNSFNDTVYGMFWYSSEKTVNDELTRLGFNTSHWTLVGDGLGSTNPDGNAPQIYAYTQQTYSTPPNEPFYGV